MSTDKSTTRLVIVLAVLALTCGCCLYGPLAALGNQFSGVKVDYQNQCEAALGPDPSVTVTATTTTTAPTAMISPSPLPSTNPYVSLTFEPDDPDITDRDRACASALKSAPYQPPDAIQQPNGGVATACAQQLALRYADSATGDAATMVRDLIYGASAAALNGQCAVLRAPAGSDTAASGCGDPNGPARAVVLPETAGQQGYCGQRVVSSAVSPGDLVFWDYGRSGATQVGVAIGVREMVAGDPGSGRFVRLTIPESRDVVVKRVLGGER